MDRALGRRCVLVKWSRTLHVVAQLHCVNRGYAQLSSPRARNEKNSKGRLVPSSHSCAANKTHESEIRAGVPRVGTHPMGADRY